MRRRHPLPGGVPPNNFKSVLPLRRDGENKRLGDRFRIAEIPAVQPIAVMRQARPPDSDHLVPIGRGGDRHAGQKKPPTTGADVAAEQPHPGGCSGNGFNISLARPERRLREQAVRDDASRIGQEQRRATVEEVVRPLVFAVIGKIDELGNADGAVGELVVVCRKRHAAREAQRGVRLAKPVAG